MSDIPPNGLTAVEASEKIREGWLTSVELTEACLKRIEETDPQIGAWAHIDREKALARARQCDEMRTHGRPLGALHGIPVGLKDIIDTRDFPTERGTPVFKDRLPETDARIVERLHEEGAVILGKTVTTELAFLHPAGTRNPHNPEHSPGGSSSGSAAAIAAFHVPLAIGTQTNGSVIRPAAYCGITGFKPTRGVIPRTGILQTSKSLDQVGVFARSIEDAALLTDAISGYDPRDTGSYGRARPAMLAGARQEVPVEPSFAWFDLPFANRLSSDAVAGLNEVVQAMGGTVTRLQAPDTFEGLLETQRIIHEYEICQHLETVFADHWEQISTSLQPVVERGREIGRDEYEHALGVMTQLESFAEEFFHDYDAIITPSCTGEAPLASEGTGDPVFCTLWTLAGLPCLNLPLLVGENGLPIGVQLVSAREKDDRLLRTANWLVSELSGDNDKEE